tara:strand:+ start:802 stop:1287 length:486 start_codon:yes stop_codon:yes gene_type:complete
MSEESKFRKVAIDPNQRGIKKKLSMVQSFASALASRSVTNKKINTAVKQLRVLSCFGDGKELPPCEYLENSKVQEGKNFCGACGCGDKKMTWLISEADEYSKLDYPKVSCPLNMPGFSNYIMSTPDEAESPITRKYYIENIDYKDVQKVAVKIGIEKPKEE